MEYNPRDLFSADAQRVIRTVNSSAARTADDLIRIQEANDRSRILNSVLSSWYDQQSQERRLRKLYAKWFIAFMGFEILCLCTAYFLIGSKVLFMSNEQFNVFFISFFGELTALVLIITRYLFPKNNDIKMLEILKDDF